MVTAFGGLEPLALPLNRPWSLPDPKDSVADRQSQDSHESRHNSPAFVSRMRLSRAAAAHTRRRAQSETYRKRLASDTRFAVCLRDLRRHPLGSAGDAAGLESRRFPT